MKKSKETTPFGERAVAWIGSGQSLIAHTIVFSCAFGFGLLGVPWDTVLLVLTTAVSLEAIYLAIFIQMTVNRTTQSLAEVEENLEEIQEDVDEIQEDIEGIQEDVDEIQEDVDEIQEDIEEIEEDEQADEKRKRTQTLALQGITEKLEHLLKDIEALKQK